MKLRKTNEITEKMILIVVHWKSPLRGGSKNREVSPFICVPSSFRSTQRLNGKSNDQPRV
ncbi:CNT_collapsed_G0015170.mRNA.1.CDS.1 [Saccharomyces cerevisiae]|nr:CNT_collapsed_G0015170.mRNA.1.CDS.1 [Saccharomyces cerevisiae]